MIAQNDIKSWKLSISRDLICIEENGKSVNDTKSCIKEFDVY